MPQNKEWEITKIVGKSKERLLTKAPSPLVLVPSQNKTYDLLLTTHKPAHAKMHPYF